jgi:hypothetical protein
VAQTNDTGQMSVDTTNVFKTNEKLDTREVAVTWAWVVGDANKISIIITRSHEKKGIRRPKL